MSGELSDGGTGEVVIKELPEQHQHQRVHVLGAVDVPVNGAADEATARQTSASH